MTLIALPSKVYFESVDSLKLQRSGVSMRSRYTGKRQAIVFPFAVWTFQGTPIMMDGTDAGEWRAFLALLQGEKNTFKLPVPGTETGPLSAFSGTAAVGTAGALAGAVSMPITTTGGSGTFLKKGDYFTVNDELKLCTADCAVGTNVTLSFEPFLRVAVTSGMALTVTNPYVVLALADGDQADWALEHPVQHKFKLKAVEAF